MAEIVQWKAAIVGVWFASVFILERISVSNAPPNSKARLFKNFGLWLMVFALSPLIVLPIANWAEGVALWARPQWMLSWRGLLLDLVLLDLWIYWMHRAYHEVPLMWRLHAPHHLDAHLDSTSAVRFHVGEVALSALLRVVPIIVLAIPFVHVVAFEILVLVAAIFHHSNVRMPAGLERGLSRIIVTPSIHWVHHHAVRADTDANYATFLSVWDRLFGSVAGGKRTRTMKIGCEGIEDQSFLGLILYPFLNNGRAESRADQS